nr:hypothetical protein [Planctomycetota bacterium]
MSLRLLLPLLLLAPCPHPAKEGVSPREDPHLLGPNITAELTPPELRLRGRSPADV